MEMKTNLSSFVRGLHPGDSWAAGLCLNAGEVTGGCLSSSAGWRAGCRVTGPRRQTSSADLSCWRPTSGSHCITQTTERDSDTEPRPPTHGGRAVTDSDRVPLYCISHITEMFDISTYEINLLRIQEKTLIDISTL